METTTVMIQGVAVEIPYDPVIICYRGSHSFGTYIPPEEGGIGDTDILGIFIPPLTHYFGTESFDGRDFWVNSIDVVTYSFSKFINLLLKGNPNCVGTLWTRPEEIITASHLGEVLIANRDLFLAKGTVVKAFKGYAAGQMHKMTHFLNSSFYRELDDLEQQLKELGILEMTHDQVPVEHREITSRYIKMKKRLYQGYMGEKRKALVDEFGFDTKNASHLIRLLTMCVEMLRTGELFVYREHDAQTFIDIKKGVWSLEMVSERAEQLFAQIRDEYDSSPLPEEPDYSKVNEIVTEWLYDHYFKG